MSKASELLGKIQEAAPKVKVDDEVVVPASKGDAYGEKGVVLQIKDGQAEVQFKDYKKWVKLDDIKST